MSEVTFSAARVVDLPKISDLFRNSFYREMDTLAYSMRFFDNPFGATPAELAWCEGEVIAHYGCCAARSMWSGTIHPTAQSMTTMTHPKYEGRGLFRALLERLYHRLAGQGVRFVFGFPNHRSHYAFVNRAGWRDVSTMHFLDGNAPGASTESVEIVSIAQCALEALPVVAGFSQPHARTAGFMNWRYANDNTKSYHAAVHRPSGAVVVFKHTPGEAAAADVLELTLPACPLEERSRMLRALLGGLASTTGLTRIHTWFSVNHPVYPALERLDFKPRGPITYFGLRVLSGDVDEHDLTDQRNWVVSMGDSDVF